jgi:hypothetical protein
MWENEVSSAIPTKGEFDETLRMFRGMMTVTN